MNPSIIAIIAFPLLIIGIGLSVRPLPLRVDASEPADRMAQRCQRISFLLLAVPAVVMGILVALIVHRFSGGPGLLAYRSFLSTAGKLWEISSLVGIVFAAGGSFFTKKRGQGYELIAVHVILLLTVIVGSYLQYAGHPD